MKKKPFLFFLIFFSLLLLAYLPSLQYELIWDSTSLINENDLLKGPFRPLAPFRHGYWATTSQAFAGNDYYRPLTILSFMTEKALFGLSSKSMRLFNLVFFYLACLSLFLLMRRFCVSPPERRLAYTAMLLFACFPLHLDNIIWVVARGDLLMILFAFPALLLADIYLEKKTFFPAFSACLAFGLALLAKESALFFLPILILLPLLRRQRPQLAFSLALLLTASGHWLLKGLVTGRQAVPMKCFPGFLENVLQPLGVLGYYLRSLFYPLHYDMFLAVDDVQGVLYRLLGAVFLLSLGAGFFLARHRPFLILPLSFTAIFIGAHLLMIYTPIYPYAISTRYLLVPLAGFCWLLALAIDRLPVLLRRVLPIALAVLFLSVIPLKGAKYRNETAFWASALVSAPHDPFFLSKCANQMRLAGRLDQARALLLKAMERPMQRGTALTITLLMADIALRQGHPRESLEWLERLDEFYPGSLHLKRRELIVARIKAQLNRESGFDGAEPEER